MFDNVSCDLGVFLKDFEARSNNTFFIRLLASQGRAGGGVHFQHPVKEDSVAEEGEGESGA
jgi:hypothetical protein